MNFFSNIESINPTRNFNELYIVLDSLFILIFLGLLLYKKKYQTIIFAIFGGILYFIVDYGYFYLLSHSRMIFYHESLANNGLTALILLWMSLSYGITNFAFIWLCLRKDKQLKEFLFLIIMWWLIAPSLSSLGGKSTIMTTRTTNQYHGYMALLLLIGYLSLIIYNLNHTTKKAPLLFLNLIGISVQFSWEFALLVNGIRPLNSSSFSTIIINSLIETNLGMPYIYCIFILINKHFTEDLKKIS